MNSPIVRSVCCALVLAAALLPARQAAAQMRDAETPAPRTWPVLLAPPLTDAGVALLQEVSAAVELLPEQVTSTRRVAVVGSAGETVAASHREIAVVLTAAQLGRLRQWQAAHPQQAQQLGLSSGQF